MELRNKYPKEEKKDTKEMPLRLKDISRPRIRKTVHKQMTKYHNNVHYENIDIIKKILRKLKVNARSSEINTIRNEVKKWIATNHDKKEDGDSKKGIVHDQEIPAAESLLLKENTISEIKCIIPPVPPPLRISCEKKEITCIDLTLDEDIKEEKNDEQQQALPDDDDMHDINAVLNAHQLDDDSFMKLNDDVDNSGNFTHFYHPQVTFLNPYFYGVNPFTIHPFYY